MNDAGRVGFVMRGAYSPTESYDFLDVVEYLGSSFVAKKLTTGNAPDDDSEFWHLFARGINPEEYIKSTDYATSLTAGIVKPDGETITVDTDGTIHGITTEDELVFNSKNDFPETGDSEKLYIDTSVTPSLIYRWDVTENDYVLTGGSGTGGGNTGIYASDDTGAPAGAILLNADTLGGHSPDYFAVKSIVEQVLAEKLDAAKVVESLNVTEVGFAAGAKTVSEAVTQLNSAMKWNQLYKSDNNFSYQVPDEQYENYTEFLALVSVNQCGNATAHLVKGLLKSVNISNYISSSYSFTALVKLERKTISVTNVVSDYSVTDLTILAR